jgi:hypothetical protein
MRRTLAACIALLALGCSPSGSPPGGEATSALSARPLTGDMSADAQAVVLGVVQGLFDALATGDARLLREHMDPSVVMHFSETRDGRTTYGSSTVEGLANRIESSAEPLIERMWDPVVTIQGSLANVWTPYDFYVGTEFSHCGIDSVTLMDTEGGWRIIGLAWTRLQPPACALHPDGPPSP